MIFPLNLLNNFCWKHCLLNKFFPEWRNMVRRTTSGKKIFVISAFSFIVTFSLICALFALRNCAHRGSVAESWPQATRRLRGHRPHGAIMRSPQPGIRQGRFPASLIAPQVRSAYSHCTRRSSSHAPPPHTRRSSHCRTLHAARHRRATERLVLPARARRHMLARGV